MSRDDAVYERRHRRTVFPKFYYRTNNDLRRLDRSESYEPAMIWTVRILGGTGLSGDPKIGHSRSDGGPALDNHLERVAQSQDIIWSSQRRAPIGRLSVLDEMWHYHGTVAARKQRVKAHHANQSLRILTLADGDIERDGVGPSLGPVEFVEVLRRRGEQRGNLSGKIDARFISQTPLRSL